MISVEAYALEIEQSVETVLEKCRALKIKAKVANDILTKEQVIELDQTFLALTAADDIGEEEVLAEIISKANLKETDLIKREKLKKQVVLKQTDFLAKRKEMYKNKMKLMTNIPDVQADLVLYQEGMTVNDLASALNVSAPDLIKKLMELGLMLNINSPLSFDEAELLVVDYNKELKRAGTQDEANFEELEIIDDQADLVPRPPVITIMGHVDHGKTSLLDKIRETKVVAKEFGGITQHIGAYQIIHQGQKLTFIDTPGHEAFTAMRARGASVTDIVLIIVAADDGVMPQTKEAIDHAKAAKVPMMVVINKIDKKEADIEKVMAQMTESGLTPEEWGGDTIFVKVSAQTGEGISELLESLILLASMEELKANPHRYALGTVIEAKLNKNVGRVQLY